jgi:hypothetical protein
MLTNPQVVFAMFSLCYAQLLNYLQCTIFPSPNILQHYTKFDVHTIIMLEKLLGSGSFFTIVDHLASHQITLLVFSQGLKLPSVVQLVAPAFLGCWTLIIPTLVFRFQ